MRSSKKFVHRPLLPNIANALVAIILLNKLPKKIVFLALAIILLAVLVFPHSARAGWLDLGLEGVVNGIVTFILNFVQNAISFFADLFDKFIQWQTQNAIYGVVVVDQSWTIIRNFVNMFFILILIVMAFGTIFDIKQYTWREMLAPFLISALLVNFSLTIGQYIITVANGLSGIFLKQIGSVSGTFAQGFNVVGIATSGLTDLVKGVVKVDITLIFAVIFLTIVMLAFAAAAIFSLVRIFMLWFLLITSPIAWIGYSLPNLRGKTWGEWWSQFFCWCFFLPYYLFFVMFAVIFVKNRGTIPPIPGSGTTAGMTGTDFLFYALSLIFLIGGLVVARKMACASGTGIKTVFGKIEGGVRKYAPGAAYVRGAWGGLKARGEEIQEKGVLGIGGAQRVRETEVKAKGWIAGIPGLGRVPGAREEVSRAMAAETDKELKKLQTLNLTLDQLNEKLKSGGKPERLAAFKLKAENGWLEASDLGEVNKIIGEAGGGRTALGMSIIQSLKKGKFHEMARSTADKENIFNNLEDVEVKKAFGLDMAESRELMSTTLATKLLDLYKGDAQETKKKVEDAVKNNIENMAKDKTNRETLVTNPAIDSRVRKLAGQVMADKKEVDSWKLRRNILELSGGIDTATGLAMTAEGRTLAKSIDDGNILFKEEGDYRGDRGIAHNIDLNSTQRTEVHEQILGNVKAGYVKGFSTEELKTPEIFNALWAGLYNPPSPALAISAAEFKKLTGISGKGKPDRKKRVAAENIMMSGGPMPY